MKRHALAVAVLTALALTPSGAAQKHKELGRMWTFEHAPLDWFEAAYGFRPTQEWLDHLRSCSLRFNRNCSASFISPRGLIITNNHCAQEHVGKVTPPDANWIVDGFFAASLEQEIRVPDLRVEQLVQTRNITAKMNTGLTDDMSAPERQERLRENRIAIIRTAEAQQPDLVHDVVTLYHGGNYQLYSYKVYDDVRLVCAPQKAIAEFGGDPDNFTYPRFCLDFALCRAWENGEPADTTTHYLRWKSEGPSEGDAVFVSGNPGSTGRLQTIAQMEFLRDVEYPRALEAIAARIDTTRARMEADPEAAKSMQAELLSLENALKAYSGYLAGLKNPEIMEIKRRAEERLRKEVMAREDLAKKYGGAWTELESIVASRRDGASGSTRELMLAANEAIKLIGEAIYEVYGTEIPPDATLSLRLSDGVVKGYPYNGTIAPWCTTLYGLFARHHEFGGEPPFGMPDAWLAKEPELDLRTRFNFVTTCDIIGGNSGSPLVDTDGRFVGLVFDGNIESLGNRFVFTDDVARTLCVHPAIIIEALRKVYDRAAIADELEGKGPGYE